MRSLVIGPDEGESWWQPQPSGGYVTTYITPETNPYHDFSSGLQVLPKGGQVREHGHTVGHELIYITQGTGVVTIDGKAHDVKAGCTVLFAHNEPHIIENTGDVDLHMFWVFLPPKLEEWFRAIGIARTPGDTEPPPFPRPPNTEEAMAFQKFVKPKT